MGIEVALLEWVNTFALTEDVKTLNELADAHILWDILRDVDPTYFTSSLPEGRGNTAKWIPRCENLKHLHKALAAYISEECDQVLFAPRAEEGLTDIAQHASVPEFRKLFQLVLQATIYSPNQQEYILKMTSLTPDSQQSLKELIEDREYVDEGDGQQDGVSEGSTTFVADPQLELEERFAKIMAHNERLLQNKRDMVDEIRAREDRLNRLQDNNAVMQEKLSMAEDLMQMHGSVNGGRDGVSLKELESKIKQQENDFADQENRMAKQARKTDALQRKIDNLERSSNSSAKKAQETRDELDEVKRERDSLAKKANMVDKLKQQQQTSNGLKKELDTLRGQLDDSRRELDDFAALRKAHAVLQNQHEEVGNLVSRIEEDNAEFGRVKRQLELENEALEKQHKEDQAALAQATRSVRSSSVSSVGSNDNDDLGAEFSGLTAKQAKEKERISNTEKQNKQLHETAEEQALKIASLQRMLDEANSRVKPKDVRRSSFTSSPSKERRSSTQRFGIPVLNGNALPAHSLISLDECQRLRKQLDDEQVKGKQVGSSLRDALRELNAAKKDRELLLYRYMNVDEQHSNHLAVALVALDKLEMIAQIKADAANEAQNGSPPHEHPQLTQEVKDLIAEIKAGKEPNNPSKAFDNFSTIIIQSNKELAEVQKVHREIVLPVLNAEPSKPSPAFFSVLRRSK